MNQFKIADFRKIASFQYEFLLDLEELALQLKADLKVIIKLFKAQPKVFAILVKA